MSNVDEVVSQIMVAAGGRRECWAMSLTGDAAEVVRRLREEERNGNKPQRELMRKVLVDTFGITASLSSIRRHLTGSCGCE